MALEPCRVCGTLNSKNADVCLSCGHPINGRRRSPVYQWAAIILLLSMVSLIITGIVDAINAPPPVPGPLHTPTLDV